ncbi:hypothetical protein SDC9_177979 [bioreactor metagenome]|uniref:Uncharacterized protein n=1 Tax=bioreactor metagenome TaxID=1076179 RepID=A0A645GUJ4_9ZZZZ
MMVSLNEREIVPDILIMETASEKIRPDTTGAGIAYFFKIDDLETMPRPRKITMAAKPSVVKYSNLNEAIAPFAAGV